MREAGRKKHDDVNAYRKNAIKAAKELVYGSDTLFLIKKAETIPEIDRVLRGARKGVII